MVALSQTKLREQVEELFTQMTRRMGSDASFKKILELLPKAIAEMKNAEGRLQASSPDGALPPEQKALQFLQQAEEEYEVQVQTQRQQGGGGAGGQQQNKDLSDLFEMEVDRMANQYETRQQAAAAAGGPEARRARGEAEGTRATTGTGGGTPASQGGGRPDRVRKRRREFAARARRAGGRSGPAPRAAVA